ncbi:MerR family transcriptional regulator [SAR202 cluster bacterium AD-804-J14_MRT_500m]|nr:MerR family transcriptional regulator [SAR202 cluster bacterium AD-804-J14_MRT_500m]
MQFEKEHQTEPYFVISVAARLVGLHAQTLRYYERAGLLNPSRSGGRQRLYSVIDIERLRRIKTLTDEMGANLAGAEIALKLMDRINQMQQQIDMLTTEIQRLRSSPSSNRRRLTREA